LGLSAAFKEQFIPPFADLLTRTGRLHDSGTCRQWLTREQLQRQGFTSCWALQFLRFNAFHGRGPATLHCLMWSVSWFAPWCCRNSERSKPAALPRIRVDITASATLRVLHPLFILCSHTTIVSFLHGSSSSGSSWGVCQGGSGGKPHREASYHMKRHTCSKNTYEICSVFSGVHFFFLFTSLERIILSCFPRTTPWKLRKLRQPASLLRVMPRARYPAMPTCSRTGSYKRTHGLGTVFHGTPI
jgi:hypothetical protein